MKANRIVSFILTMLLIFNIVVFSASAKTVDKAQTGSITVEVTTYDELKKFLYNSPNGERYVLQNDIVIVDNDNDNTIEISSFTDCILDLNGYTLSRSTRGIDNCLMKVNSEANFSVVDSSVNKSGKMIFSSGNYAGTSSVIIANGNVDIYGGNYEIKTPYEVGGGVVFLVETGYLNIYDGVFDSHTAFGGDTIELRHNSYLYDVPHCNVFGGTFYGKISNFDVTSYSNFSAYGCFYPSVYVFDGEFYIAKPDDEYAGFAYCNNGWGQVIVAGGTTFYKCLNSTDQRYIDGVSKDITKVEFAGKTGQYYEITPPTMVGGEGLTQEERLLYQLMKKEVSYYSKKGTVYKENQEYIDSIENYIESIDVASTQEKSPLIWIENKENVKTVSWYMSDEAHYDGKNTPWSELVDYRGKVNPFTFEFRPEEETVLYIRSLITMDDGSETEDVIAIHYEELKPNPPVSYVEVTGIDEPSVGVKPDFTATPVGDEFYISAVYWTDVTTSKTMKETDTFEAGHTYELQVWLRTNDGYKFRTDAEGYIDITATIGGKEAEVAPVDSEISAILSVTFSLEEHNDCMLGDVDGNKKITIMDATAIQRYIAKQLVFSDEQLLCADTDKDTKISIMDVTAIQRYIAKLISEF